MIVVDASALLEALLQTPAAIAVEERLFDEGLPLHAPHLIDVLLERVWELRHNLTACDAVYVALAEGLDAGLLTRDRRMATAAGHDARVELV